jgi:hypothetical protein
MKAAAPLLRIRGRSKAARLKARARVALELAGDWRIDVWREILSR